jgi:hypothetical protein
MVATAIVHDIFLMVVAVYAHRLTPPSISAALGILEYVWVVMLLVGGVAGTLGTVFRWVPVEITGCVLMASGKITWAVSTITVYNTPGSWALAAFLLAGASSNFRRAADSLAGLYLRMRD